MTTVTSGSIFATPTLLELASRVRREVTKESLTSLTDDPINNYIVDSINDAVTDIYFRTRWTWTKTVYNLRWVSGQNEYTLPGNFRQMATEPVINSVAIKEVSPEEWWRNTYAPSWNSNSSISGQPSIYMVDSQLLRFWPLPSDDFVAQCPVSQYYYYRQPSIRLELTDPSGVPDVPPEFTEALVRFAVSRLKIFLQYSDFQLDQQRYDQIVLQFLQTDNMSVHPTRVRPRNWRTANFG